MTVAKDLQHFLSEQAKSRKDAPLKSSIALRKIPGMRSLGGGLPVPSLFPFDNLHANSPAPPFSQGIELDDFSQSDVLDISVFRDIGKGPQADIELASSLQYADTMGDQRLRDFIKDHLNLVHKIRYDDWDVILSVGNTYTWESTVRTFVDPGDTILVEEFSFPIALDSATYLGAKTVGVRMDLEGIIPEALETQMANWNGPRPKLLYTIPTGQNPMGSTLSAKRREAIYKIAQKYDFLIVEDEPYYYLQFPKYSHPEPGKPHVTCESASTDEMLRSFVPSFLDFDIDGRVIRLDSFSKVIAPGTRLSWVVAQKRFIERYLRLQETSIQNTSGLSTSIVYGLLRRWGQQGYLSWLNKLKASYAHSRDVACDAIFENFPSGRYDIEPPTAGMFYWFKIDARRFKGFKELGGDVTECEKALFQRFIDQKILVAPSFWFLAKAPESVHQVEAPKTNDEKYAMYFRGTFAGVDHKTSKSALADIGRILHDELTEELQA